LRLKTTLLIIFIILCGSFLGYSNTTVPLQLKVSAVINYSDGTSINTVTSEDVKIGLYNSDSEIVWIKTYSLMIVDGLIEATLKGTGQDAQGDEIILDETLFDTENLRVGFTILESGQEMLALVELTSQPFAIKSARSDYALSAGDTLKIKGITVSSDAPEANEILAYKNDEWVPSPIDGDMINIHGYNIVETNTNEVVGNIGNLKVVKLLGKNLTSAVKNGEQIPTGALMMFSPDVEAPNGSFHPSSGNPNQGEVLTWDSNMNVWEPSSNTLAKLDDVVPASSSTPTKNMLIYDITNVCCLIFPYTCC